MSDSQERLKAAKNRVNAFSKSAGDVMKAFAGVSKVATKPGEFDAGQRELIAVALSVVQHCDDCIVYHVEAAKKHGATEASLIEVLEVAIEMGGGPAVMYASRAHEAWRNV